MPSYTIITTTSTFGVEGDRWVRDDEGDLYVYGDDDSGPVATVNAPQFVAILRTDDAVDDADDLADFEPGLSAQIDQTLRDALHDMDSPLTGTRTSK